MKTYKAKSGATLYKQSAKTLQHVIEGDNSEGFCLACGKRAHGVEPDARRYKCESCGESKVYGAEELMMMGLCY